MNIAIVLLKRATKPIGGYKMVYDYANALAQSGDTVEIFYNYSYNLSNKKHIPVIVKKAIYSFLYKFTKPWYSLQPSVRETKVWSADKIDFSSFDAAIATSAHTAYYVGNCKAKRKFYFIQGYENWDMTDEELLETYRLPMKHIVISEWLKEILKQNGEAAFQVSNGIDEKVFYETVPQQNRKARSVAFMYHIDKIKGVSTGLEVINRLKDKYPDLTVKMFGAYPKGADVPDWVDYTMKADSEQLRDIYNGVQVFLSTSREEGFGLTGAESMACGCVLVSTKTRGALEYARHEENALLADIDNTDQLFTYADRAFNDCELREKLSNNAKQRINSDFNSDKSKQRFVKYIHGTDTI